MADEGIAEAPRFGPRLVGSLAGHLLFAGTLFLWPSSAPPAMPAVVTVDLLATLPPSPAPARPAAAPAPAPKPVQKKVVLPKQAPALKPKPKPKPVKQPARVERPRRPKPEPALDYEDALDLLRMEQGEQRPPERVDSTATPPDDAATGAQGLRASPWQVAAGKHVSARWVTPQEFLDRQLMTVVLIELAADGTVIGTPRVTNSSGDPYWDDNTVRAILSASPLPAPPEPGPRSFIFTPGDRF